MGRFTQHKIRGFSLAETLISLAMLSTVIVGFSGAVDSSLRMARHQKNLSQAIGVLDSVTERLLLASAADSVLTEGAHQQFFDRDGYNLSSSSGAFYTVDWTVLPYDATPGIRQVSFRNSWKQGTSTHVIGWTTYRN